MSSNNYSSHLDTFTLEQGQSMTADPKSVAIGITLLRLSLGTMWIAHALLKLFVFSLPGTAQYFQSVGFPSYFAYPIFAAELLGGLAILLGVYARQVSLLLTPIMIVATWVHMPNGWVHTSVGGGWEYPAFLCAASIVLWLVGGGALNLRESRILTPRV
jgi:putative oxidoreductase